MNRRPHRHRQGNRLRKDSRTIPRHGDPVQGDGRDDRRFWTDWHCGFVCDIERDALGDSQTRNGVTFEDLPIPALGRDQDPFTGIVVLGGIGHIQVALENGSDGTPKTIRHDLRPVASRGCPFCGTMNWRGDFP